jgi:hypothetical protein
MFSLLCLFFLMAGAAHTSFLKKLQSIKLAYDQEVKRRSFELVPAYPDLTRNFTPFMLELERAASKGFVCTTINREFFSKTSDDVRQWELTFGGMYLSFERRQDAFGKFITTWTAETGVVLNMDMNSVYACWGDPGNEMSKCCTEKCVRCEL